MKSELSKYEFLHFYSEGLVCKVKLSNALDATHTSCGKCNMKLKQKPGEEKLLISKRKPFSLNKTNIFFMKIFFIEKNSVFLFLGRPES